tara:strand:+ start:271 stop:840 length:570 start_codon:yes stop_codon:yes gene_type:complete
MIDYIPGKAAIQDQVSSYNTAINEIKKMRSNYEKHMLGDFRGDNEKVLDALEQAINHLKAQRKETWETYFGKKTSKHTPRKFFYQETVYFGTTTKIEWTNKGLDVTELERFEYPDHDAATLINPSDKSWEQFEKNIKNLDLKPVEPEDMILDGKLTLLIYVKILMSLGLANYIPKTSSALTNTKEHSRH